MIFDKLSNIHLYQGINPNLDTAIRFILSHDLHSLPLGKTAVNGDLVYVNVMEATASPAAEKEFELHREYMDIQIDLEGIEVIETGDSSCMELSDYNPRTDFGNATCPGAASCRIGPGNFIICMPSEPHKPGICVSPGNSFLKKCVFKVHR